MANSLIDLYLGSDSKDAAASTTGSLMDTYLGAATETPKARNEELVPRLDLSAGHPKLIMVPQSEVDEQLKKQNQNDTLLNKAKTAVSDLGSSFGESYVRNLKSAVNMTGQGTGELVSGSPISGLSRVGLGMMGGAVAATSLPTMMEGAEYVIKNATGNPEFANKATALGGFALPAGPIKAGIKAVSPSSRAFKDLVDTIGIQNIPAVVAELKSNPRLTIPDVSLPARMMTQKLITTEGNHQGTFQKHIEQRVSSARSAVEDVYNDTMGVPVNVLDKLNAYKKAARDVGTQTINPAIKGAGPVDVSGVVKDIDASLKPGVNSVISAGHALPMGDIQNEFKSVRDLLTDDKSLRTDAQSLHDIQSSLRARADDLLNSTDGASRQKGYALMQLRNKLVDAIDAASPKVTNAAGEEVGTYRQGLSKYRDEKDIESAFTKGYQITRNRPGQWTDRPEYWEQWVKDASPQEKAAAIQGARTAVDHQINAMRFGARRGTDIPEVEFNKQKLQTLLPGEDTDKMFKLLSDERKIADTNSKYVQDSQTAMRMKADSRVDLPTKRELGINSLIALGAEGVGNLSLGIPGLGPAAFTGLTGANIARNKLARTLAMKKNEELTNLITATGEDRAKLISGLEGVLKQPKLSLINRAKLALPVAP